MFTDRRIWVYRGLAAAQDSRSQADLRVFGQKAQPSVTTSTRVPEDDDAPLVRFMNGVAELALNPSPWDDIPWEIHRISDKIAREAAYHGWASQNGQPPATAIIERLNTWFSGDLYEI